MGIAETIVSPFPTGSARKRDFMLPDYRTVMTGGAPILERDRPGGTNTQGGASSPGTTGALTMGIVGGVPCIQMTNGVNLNGGPVYIFDGGGRISPATTNTNIKFTQNTDDFNCWRIYAVMRVTATPGNATDCGLQLILGANAGNGVLRSSVPGWAMQFDNTGGCSLVQHGNSGAQTSVVLQSAAQGFVNTAWNMFEMRILGATASGSGFFKCLLNGQLKVLRSFASGPDDLPLPSSPGANSNNMYVTNIQYQAQNGELDVAIVRSQAAPFEAALF